MHGVAKFIRTAGGIAQREEVNISGSCHERADGITAACSYSRYLQRAAVGLGAQILVYYGSVTE